MTNTNTNTETLRGSVLAAYVSFFTGVAIGVHL